MAQDEQSSHCSAAGNKEQSSQLTFIFIGIHAASGDPRHLSLFKASDSHDGELKALGCMHGDHFYALVAKIEIFGREGSGIEGGR